MKKTTLAVAIAAVATFAQSSQAREYHDRHVRHHVVRPSPVAEPRWGWTPGERFAWQPQPEHSGAFGFSASGFDSYPQRSADRGRDYGRPAAWCGWEMRRLVASDPGPAFNLARNWANWGRPGPAGIGAVVVWPHHVGKIVGQENGQWIIESGNDGHALRTRARSIAGVIAIRWG